MRMLAVIVSSLVVGFPVPTGTVDHHCTTQSVAPVKHGVEPGFFAGHDEDGPLQNIPKRPIYTIE